jgi:hypothetical protein
VGLDGLTEFMRIWTEDFDRWELRTERVVGAGDEVAVLAGQSALGKASGAPVETSFGMVFTGGAGGRSSVRPCRSGG